MFIFHFEVSSFLQPVVVLRGQPHFAKRLPDPPLLSSVAKRPKLFETLDASRIVGSDSSQLEMVNGKVRKVPSDAYGEYCKEMSDECKKFVSVQSQIW